MKLYVGVLALVLVATFVSEVEGWPGELFSWAKKQATETLNKARKEAEDKAETMKGFLGDAKKDAKEALKDVWDRKRRGLDTVPKIATDVGEVVADDVTVKRWSHWLGEFAEDKATGAYKFTMGQARRVQEGTFGKYKFTSPMFEKAYAAAKSNWKNVKSTVNNADFDTLVDQLTPLLISTSTTLDKDQCEGVCENAFRVMVKAATCQPILYYSVDLMSPKFCPRLCEAGLAKIKDFTNDDEDM